MRQRLAVHVGLPGDAEAHLAADVPHLELVVRRLGAVDPVERLLVVEARPRIVDVACDREVEDVALRRLDAHGADQHELGEIGRCHAGHLGGDPAAEAQPDQDGVADLQLAQQTAIDHGNVARTAHPLRPLRAAVARMVRHQHVVLGRERIIERQAVERAGLMMQHQERASAPRTHQMQLGAGGLHRGGRPVHIGHSFPSLSRCDALNDD
jgi:hypothetical protein